MNNILVSFFSGLGHKKIPVFYESFMRSLAAEGNNVYYLITNTLVKKAWNGRNASLNSENDEKLLSLISSLNLDLIIAYNNSIPNIIHENFDIKTLIAEADSYRYYNDKEYLKKAGDRFSYVTACHENIAEISKNFGVSKQNIHKVELATNLEAEDIEIQRQLVFLGSPFNHSGNIKKRYADQWRYSEMIEVINQSVNHSEFGNYSNRVISDYFSHGIRTTQDFIDNGSAIYRHTILEKVSSLDLEVFGSGWKKKHSPIIFRQFNDTPVVTADENQKLYNSSRISLNINHLQAGSSYSWRVLDIAATNSLLVSNYCRGINDFFGDKVKIPMFETANEAYDLVKYLLNNKNYMQEIVLASQEVINSKGRWVHRLKDYSEITGLNLLNTKYEPGIQKISLHEIKIPVGYKKLTLVYLLKPLLLFFVLILGEKFAFFIYKNFKIAFPNLAFLLNELRKINLN